MRAEKRRKRPKGRRKPARLSRVAAGAAATAASPPPNPRQPTAMAGSKPVKLGFRSTAIEALRGADLTGKVAVVTGEGARAARPIIPLARCALRLAGRRPGLPGYGQWSSPLMRPTFVPHLQALAGGNSGLGAETIRALAHAGADCVLCCRNEKAGQAVAADLQPTVKVRPGSVQAHRHATAAAHCTRAAAIL